jgi:hypothetical protein
MEAVLAASVAVIGTLLGSIVTYVLQRRTAEHLEEIGRLASSRQELLNAFSAFAGDAVQYRLAELDWWHRHDEDPDGETCRLAKADAYRLRAQLIDAQLRVQLITADGGIRKLASEVVNDVSQIHKATTAEEREASAQVARDLLNEFVNTASALLPLQSAK